MKYKSSFTALIISYFFVQTAFSQVPSGLHVVKTFHIASAGGWDYLQ